MWWNKKMHTLYPNFHGLHDFTLVSYWNTFDRLLAKLHQTLFFLILYPHWPCQFHLCLQIQQVSEGNPIPECFLLTVTDAICSDIISFPTGETQQVRLEKFRHSHCLIHDGDELACRHEVEQLAVWFSRNNQEQYAAKKLWSCDWTSDRKYTS